MIVYFIRKGGNIPSQGYLKPPYKEVNDLNSLDNDIKKEMWKVDGVILQFEEEVEELQANYQGSLRTIRKLRREKEEVEQELTDTKGQLAQLIYEYENKIGGKHNVFIW